MFWNWSGKMMEIKIIIRYQTQSNVEEKSIWKRETDKKPEMYSAAVAENTKP